jgi:hypothetical protein
MNADAGDLEKYERTRDRLFSDNMQAVDAVRKDFIPKMETIFKTGGIKQDAIDFLMLSMNSVQMMKLFLRYGGDMHKLGPTDYPHPISLLIWFSSSLEEQNSSKYVQIVEFLIEEDVDVNVADSDGFTAFLYCARSGNSKLCELLVERGADPFVSRTRDKMTALHAAAGTGINRHTSTCLHAIAKCNGEAWILFNLLMSALLSNRNSTIDTWPAPQAICKGP